MREGESERERERKKERSKERKKEGKDERQRKMNVVSKEGCVTAGLLHRSLWSELSPFADYGKVQMTLRGFGSEGPILQN